MFKRQNVYQLGDDWSDTVLWYARGVKQMKARPLDDVTSWKFYGAIHGYLRFLWDLHGITNPADPSPSQQDEDDYMNQCQHQSWFFLPWHRGYLFALERQIRAEIEHLGGPHETWALPYWSYVLPGESNIPPAFRSADWPDGIGDNPLFVPERWGPLTDSVPFDLTDIVHLGPLSDREFSGPGNGGSTGFGGRPTSFNVSGGDNGGLEWQPHNVIHGLVGGEHPTQTIGTPNGPIPIPGLMSAPQTAGLDPIFYLHHCNIDRLWESWNSFPIDKPSINPNDWRNPSGDDWRLGPAFNGDREFAMPDTDKTKWNFTPAEVENLDALEYSYDELEPGVSLIPTPSAMAARVSRLGITPSPTPASGVPVSEQRTVEKLGSGSGQVSIRGSNVVRSSMQLDAPALGRLSSSLNGTSPVSTGPDRVFLNLENVKGTSDAAIFKVYVGLPTGAEPSEHPDNLAGTISMFGSAVATDPTKQHAGNGITHVIEITDIIDTIHLTQSLNALKINVDLVPLGNISEGARIEIGNISIYRQSE